MKPLLLTLCATGALLGFSLSPAKRPGPCMPYAEKCLHCSDCSQCKHCARNGGKCSVCFNR